VRTAARHATNVNVDPAKSLLPVCLIEKSIRFLDGNFLVLTDDQDICFVRGFPARFARPRNNSGARAKMTA
jgi:hypothetical protein